MEIELHGYRGNKKYNRKADTWIHGYIDTKVKGR